MSNLTPDRAGGQQTRGRTANVEARVAPANSQLPFDSNRLQVLAVVLPGSLGFSPSMSSVDNKHGTTAVVVERHMSERSAGFNYKVADTTKLIKELRNASSLKPIFKQAVSGFTQSTILLGSTASQLSLTSAAGATTGDKVYGIWHPGTLEEYEEERFIANVVGNTVNLERPFSKAPEQSSLLKRAVDTVMVEGGADFKNWTHNMKMTGDDKSVHVLHHPSVVVTAGTPDAPSNSQLMGSSLTFAANAYDYTTPSGDKVPAFSEEHDVPPNVAMGGLA